MKVFISWSGEPSRQIALALHEWLPQALQAARPYMSEADNEAGSLWDHILSAELEASDFGIVCVTPSNLESRWINFEAGALSKAVTRARVVPLLYRLSNTDVGPPLSRFMMKLADEEGVLAVLKAMNANAEPDRRLPESHMVGTFESMWPKLKSKFDAIATDGNQVPRKREDRELLEEILELLRGGNRGTFSVAERRVVPYKIVSNQELREFAGPKGRIDIDEDVITVYLSDRDHPTSNVLQVMSLSDALKSEGVTLRIIDPEGKLVDVFDLLPGTPHS